MCKSLGPVWVRRSKYSLLLLWSLLQNIFQYFYIVIYMYAMTINDSNVGTVLPTMTDDGKSWQEDKVGVEKRMAYWFWVGCFTSMVLHHLYNFAGHV